MQVQKARQEEEGEEEEEEEEEVGYENPGNLPRKQGRSSGDWSPLKCRRDVTDGCPEYFGSSDA